MQNIYNEYWIIKAHNSFKKPVASLVKIFILQSSYIDKFEKLYKTTFFRYPI